MNDKTITELGFRIIWRIASTDNTLHDLHNYWVGGTKFLLSVLCIIEFPVQLISEVFWDCISVDTRLPRFEALAYVLPHFDALTHMVIRVSSAFIFQTFDEPVCNSVFVKRLSFKSLLNLRKAYIFQEFAEGLLSICVGWIFQNVHLSKVSAAVVPQSKSTELCSSAAVVPQSKSTEMWSSAAPFHHDLWYFRHRTNEHFKSTLFILKNL